MKTEKEAEHFVKHGHKEYLSNLTIDCVIFGYHKQQLKILLGNWKGLNGLGLLGGYIKKHEPLADAALRILKEKTSRYKIFSTLRISVFEVARNKLATKNT